MMLVIGIKRDNNDDAGKEWEKKKNDKRRAVFAGFDDENGKREMNQGKKRAANGSLLQEPRLRSRATSRSDDQQ